MARSLSRGPMLVASNPTSHRGHSGWLAKCNISSDARMGFGDAPSKALTCASLGNAPLTGKRVMFTSPRQYACKLSYKLIDKGAKPVWVPGVQITSLCDPARQQVLQEKLQSLEQYTHVAFTSRNGIQAVLDALEAPKSDGMTPEGLSSQGVCCCALGADAELLHQAGVSNVLTPKEASTQGLVKELQSRGEAAGAKVLCPVPHVTGGLTEPQVVPSFLASLQAAGAEAVRVDAYETRPGSVPADCIPEQRMLAEGSIHALAFTSTAEAEGLALAVGGRDALRELLEQGRPLLAAHGPYTAAGVSAFLGMDVSVVSQNFQSFDGLVEALVGALNS